MNEPVDNAGKPLKASVEFGKAPMTLNSEVQPDITIMSGKPPIYEKKSKEVV